MSSTTSSQGMALCASAELEESGRAHVFDLLEYGQPARGFVLRFESQLVGYLNRCAHVPTEMDWQPGEFLDDSRRWIICSIHGALYEPSDGHCVGGPCNGQHLQRLQVGEQDGRVYWYPCAHFSPAFADE
jgi:nitrite reductase/ring-hydroxylating ferredoxin subunit